jgi:hypothetical protein
MSFNEDDLERRALYGFPSAGGNCIGWFNSLFEDYLLYPNLNILTQEARDLLLKRNVFMRLVPVFAKNMKIANIINQLVSMELLKPSETRGSIEEVAEIIVNEVESRKTLESRIRDVESNLSKQGHYFCGLTYPVYNRLYKKNQKPSFRVTPGIEGSLVAVEGILNHVDTVSQYDPALGARFKNSGISWILSDFPYFSMTPANPEYKGDVLGLLMDKQFEEIITQKKEAVPFSWTVGWYPYVVVFGRFRSALSASYPWIKVLSWSWMRFRRPKEANTLAPLLPTYLSPTDMAENGYQPWLNMDEDRHLFLFLSAIQIMYASQNADYSVVRPDIKQLATQVISQIKNPLPKELKTFFGI